MSDSLLVVADATPLHYLILIGEVDLLRRLYGRIVLPSGVVDELSVAKTPYEVRTWIASLPSWAEVAVIPTSESLPFAVLGRGEREAIWLAAKATGSILLTDDAPARSAAASVGIQTVPTIRVLCTAHALSLVDLEDAVDRLRQTNFRVSRKVIDDILNANR